MIKKIKHLIFEWKFKRAVKKANQLADMFKIKYYVLLLNGKIKIVPKQRIKELIKQGKFKKNVTVRDIEKSALHITL